MKKLIIVLFFASFVCGCETTANVMRYTTDIYPATDYVEVLHTKPADRDYIELGEVSIRLNDETEHNAVALLVDKSKELGANAIILMGERSRGAVAIPIGRMAVARPLRELYGVAIRYK